MASDDRAKAQLVHFLERRAFDPILKADPDRYSEADQRVLARVKEKTEDQTQRYWSYESAGHVRQEFEDDLHSVAARKVNRDLRRLVLPTLEDVREEFLELADRLGVTRGERERRPHKPHPPHPWHKKTPEARKKAWEELERRARKGEKAARDLLERKGRGR